MKPKGFYFFILWSSVVRVGVLSVLPKHVILSDLNLHALVILQVGPES